MLFFNKNKIRPLYDLEDILRETFKRVHTLEALYSSGVEIPGDIVDRLYVAIDSLHGYPVNCDKVMVQLFDIDEMIEPYRAKCLVESEEHFQERVQWMGKEHKLHTRNA